MLNYVLPNQIQLLNKTKKMPMFSQQKNIDILLSIDIFIETNAKNNIALATIEYIIKP